jgi:hypothetical protein
MLWSMNQGEFTAHPQAVNNRLHAATHFNVCSFDDCIGKH